MSYKFLTEKRIEYAHQEDSYAGVYYADGIDKENDKMWNKVFTMGDRVDFFYSNKPLEAMKARDNLQKSKK